MPKNPLILDIPSLINIDNDSYRNYMIQNKVEDIDKILSQEPENFEVGFQVLLNLQYVNAKMVVRYLHIHYLDILLNNYVAMDMKKSNANLDEFSQLVKSLLPNSTEKIFQNWLKKTMDENQKHAYLKGFEKIFEANNYSYVQFYDLTPSEIDDELVQYQNQNPSETDKVLASVLTFVKNIHQLQNQLNQAIDAWYQSLNNPNINPNKNEVMELIEQDTKLWK